MIGNCGGGTETWSSGKQCEKESEFGSVKVHSGIEVDEFQNS